MKANEMQFKDKIDEYLWKEHHILGGCCSSIESMKYAVARKVAEKLTDTFIKKACEWLFNQANIYTKLTVDSHDVSVYACFYSDKMVEDFKKAMEM